MVQESIFRRPETLLPLAPNVPEVLYVGIPPGDSAPVTIDFHAAAGALTHSATVTANPASTSNAGSDLYLTSARSGLMLYPGELPPPNGAADVVINPVGFTINGNPGTPTISLTSSLPSGMTAAPVALYEDSAGLGMNFTVTSGLIGTSGILTFQAASGSSSGSMTREIDIPYSVVAGPELTQLPIPSPTLTLPQGSSEDFYIAVASTVPNDLTATDSLGGLPSGVTWAPMASYIPGTFPEQLTVPATTAVGQTLLTITISGYARTQTTSQFTLNVVNIPSFIITPTPSALKMVAGTTQTFTLEADAINGFTGEISVKLTALGGATVTPSTLRLTLGTPQQISISAPIPPVAAPPRRVVQATGATISQSADVFVGTPAPDFSVQVPASITLGDTFGGNFPVIPTNFVGAIDEVLSGLPPGVLVGSGIFPNDIYLNRQLPLTLLANCGQILPINPSQGSCSAYDYVLEYNGAAGNVPASSTPTVRILMVALTPLLRIHTSFRWSSCPPPFLSPRRWPA